MKGKKTPFSYNNLICMYEIKNSMPYNLKNNACAIFFRENNFFKLHLFCQNIFSIKKILFLYIKMNDFHVTCIFSD